MRLDTLDYSVKSIARMSDCERKDELKAIAEELLQEYVDAERITKEACRMLVELLNE